MPRLSPISTSPFSVVLDDVSAAQGGADVLNNVSITITAGSRTAVLGPNGVGKSTLLAVIAGRLQPTGGHILRSPPTTTIGLLDQELDRTAGPSVRELLGERHGIRSAEAMLAQASAELTRQPTLTHDGDLSQGGVAERYDAALQLYLRSGAADFDRRLERTAVEVGLAPRLLDAGLPTLSGGEAERVGLLGIMLSQFDIVALDEPTNNLDLDGLRRLEDWIVGYSGAILVVSHDRAFLERTVTSVIEIDPHSRSTVTFDGGWQSYLEERETQSRLVQQRYDDYSAKRDRLTRQVQAKREWVDKGVHRARKLPADGDKHRRNHQLAQTEKLAGTAKALRNQLDRLDAVAKPRESWDLRFSINQSERGSDRVASLDNAVFKRGDFVLGPLSIEVGWGDRVAIVGPNGSGKSTLLAALLGRLHPSAGRVTLGQRLVVGELDQDRLLSDRQIEPTTLLESFQQTCGIGGTDARSVLAKFGLDSDSIQRPPSTLSPGERTRAQLAQFQARSVNVVVLDEPTNHLDIAAIEQLESALATFTGTLLLVTHDRALLNNVQITRTIDLTP